MGMNLLLVDDEVFAVEAMKNCVDGEKMKVDTVYTAYNAQSARQIIMEKQIDVIICDISMPGESGLELLKWVEEHDRRIVKIILTCHKKFDYAAQAISCGVIEYLLKPFDEEVLAKAMERARWELAKKGQKGSF